MATGSYMTPIYSRSQNKSEVRVRDLEVQALMKAIVLIPGIVKRVGGKTEIMRDTPIIADHKENLIDSKTKVSQIIADSRVDAKVDNRISDSTIRAVGKVGREIVHFKISRDSTGSHVQSFSGRVTIREFQNEFHILDNMRISVFWDRLKASRLTLDFDQKSLIIPDNLIKQLPKEEKPVDIDLTESKLGDEQQRHHRTRTAIHLERVDFKEHSGLTIGRIFLLSWCGS
ncbi:hypothetical protein TNCV_4511291 [Trichonephila clavipes]|nr:hypothetical protein TNCV_4511291 [Trichonephila clavipes]